MSKGVIISLCDFTGIMVRPWVDDGYDAILVDPRHPPGIRRDGRVTRIGQVIDHPDTYSAIRSSIDNGSISFVSGFPPCTDLAVSGARWFASKLSEDPLVQMRAMQVVWQCHLIAELSGSPWMIENPVSQISTFWRKPDFTFHPHQYTGYCSNDNYTKKTCLWTGGGFVMPDKFRDESLGLPDKRIHKCPPGPGRSSFRSATPAGFAMAVFLANK